MTPTPLGPEALRQMLSPFGRVVIANRSEPDDDITIVAAAAARHDTVGATGQLLANLDLASDESEWVDPPAPLEEPLAMVEVFLRLMTRSRIVETYVSATPTNGPALGGWEAGVRPASEPTASDETLIAELPGFAAYLTPFP